MIIRLLTGLQKRAENISEIINTEIRNNITEKRGLINKMRNTPDIKKSRLEKGEEGINDL